jgi:16S rRNA (cytosine967-C5)-methyltransferase
MPESTPNKSLGAWPAAARVVARWLDRRERVDELLATLPGSMSPAERARCQHLVFGVIRHYGRIEAELGRVVAHPPRFATRAVLFIAGFEIIDAVSEPRPDGQKAKIVHHAVEQAKHLASPAEAKLVNAVVRKLSNVITSEPPPKIAEPEALADYFSHPAWLVRRWLLSLGAEPTRRLLEWNQAPASVYARWRGTAAAAKAPEWLKETAWPGYYEVPSGRWADVEPLLKDGSIYLQDPGTRFSVELLAPKPGETILDVCAAPGGKSLLIADTMKASVPADNSASAGRVVALDLPGARIDRLKENLSRVSGVDVALVQGDIAENAAGLLKDHNLPTEYAGVLIDVPCSNTGVMRHRVDVKWRLQEGDFRKHAKQQLGLLAAAARLVAPGGRIVYSTCSIDPEENEKLVNTFVTGTRGRYSLEKSILSFPWESGHDGAGVFLLRKSRD